VTRPPVRTEVEVEVKKLPLKEPPLKEPPPREPPPQEPLPPPVETKVETPKLSTHTVELIKGSKVTEVKFEGSE